jgi:predicted nucleic acid-binding protein
MGQSLMKISKALTGVQRIYIETAPLIYYVEVNSTYIDRMDAIIDIIENTSISAISSVITLTEVLVHPLKLNNIKLEQQYRKLLTNNSDLQLATITSHIADLAANIRATYGLRTPDALHIATAIDAQCDVFLTNDKGIKRVNEITVLLLDDLVVDL